MATDSPFSSPSSSAPSTAHSTSTAATTTRSSSSITSKPTTTTTTTTTTTIASGPEYRLPTKATLRKASEHSVYTSTGTRVPFKSLYSGPGSTQRTLVLFIRHFFCGNCQEYLRSIAAALSSSSSLLRSRDMAIAVVGCGAHTLIDSYVEQLGCEPRFPFPIYADPGRELYGLLEMRYSLSLGRRSPEYIHRSLVRVNLESTVQGLRRLWAGDGLSGGDMRLNGGEFLFERGGDGEVGVSWCHRMTNSRDHVEVDVLRKVLRLDESQSKSEGPIVAVEAERPVLGRRQSTTEKLKKRFSGRRQSWMGRNNSWSGKAGSSRGGSSTENSREGSRRRSPDRTIDVVREEVRSRDGQEKTVVAAPSDGL